MRVDRERYKAILSYIGRLVFGISFTMLLPLPGLIGDYSSLHLWGFVVPAAGAAVLGWAMWKACQPETDVLSRQEAAVVVSFTWLVAMVIGAIPFIVTGTLTPLDSLYEAMSGWTGAGLSMLVDYENTHPTIFLWRSTMEYVGGAGFAVLVLSAIIGPGAVGLYEAEARTDRLVPSVLDTAKLFLQLYLLMLMFGTLLYMAVGMNLFDAVNHAMTALSAGGFSNHPASVGHFDSAAVELVTIILMLIGTINFAIHFRAISKRRLDPYRDDEVAAYIILIVLFIPLVSWALGRQALSVKGLRAAVFQVVSALSTTGFASVDLQNWSELGIVCLAVLMVIGAGTGATAGGMKLYRVALMWRLIWWSVRSRYHPDRALTRRAIWRHGVVQTVDPQGIVEVASTMAMYLVVYGLGVLVFLAHGFSLADSAFEFASALSTVGLSVGITGPTMPAALKITQMLGMWLGRLEFAAVLVALAKLGTDLAAR